MEVWLRVGDSAGQTSAQKHVEQIAQHRKTKKKKWCNEAAHGCTPVEQTAIAVFEM